MSALSRRATGLATLLAPILTALIALGLASCGTTPPKEHDYRTFLDHMPRSILVLPPLDETPEADAPEVWLSTVTRPLAERGYYVFPVAVVEGMMRENGLPTPGEMHQVSLAKLDEVFGADAVLYVTLKDWGTSYNVLESATTVTVDARLVDVKSGAELWHGSRTARRSSNDGNQQGGLAGMLAGAIASQIVSSAVEDSSAGLARAANGMLFNDARQGVLLGHRHPGFEQDQAARRKSAAASAAAASAPAK